MIRLGSPRYGDSKYGEVVFDFAKRCKIELMWQLITNRKSCRLLIATKVDDLEWPWTSIHCFVDSVMRAVIKRLKLGSRGFRYKVAPYLNYLHIKFDDEIKQNPLNFKHNFQLACVLSYTDVYVTLYLQWESPFRYVCHMPPAVSIHRRRRRKQIVWKANVVFIWSYTHGTKAESTSWLWR